MKTKMRGIENDIWAGEAVKKAREMKNPHEVRLPLFYWLSNETYPVFI